MGKFGFAVAAFVVALGGAVLGQPLIAGIALAVSLLGFVLGSASAVRARRATMAYDELSGDARTLVRPLVRTIREIEEIVERHKGAPAIRVIGREALLEAQGLLDHTTRLLQTRTELRHLLSAKQEADGDLKRAQTELGETADTIVHARTIELTRLGELERAVAKIEDSVRQAQAALAELKSRLALAAMGSQDDEHDAVRESLTALRALDRSLDEVEEISSLS